MNKFAAAAIIPLFAGYLWAQPQEMNARNPKTQTTTWKGTLVDSGCRSSQGERHTSNSTSYPATTPATSFQLITGDGRCIPLDQGSNEKVSGLLKINTNWSENSVKIEPTKVEVTGTLDGGTISVDDIEFIRWPSGLQPERPDSWPHE